MAAVLAIRVEKQEGTLSMSIHANAAQDRSRATWLCLAILLAACASASLVFACATPFAAFAVLAAAALPLRSALVTMALVWAANQAVGFGLLAYPQDLSAGAWGVGILLAALLTTAAAAGVFRCFAAPTLYAAYPAALLVAFAVYEMVLWAMVPALGGGDGFALEIVGRLAAVNAIWLVGLIAAYEWLRRLDGAAPRGAPAARPR
jgi:hypothetical protein